MNKMPSIEKDIFRAPLPIDISIIFQKKSDKTSIDNARLYQDILKFGIGHEYTDSFRFTDLAHYLLQRNEEFYNYYTGSKAHVSISARIANNRRRIQNCIDNLQRLGLICEKSFVKAEKNKSQAIPLYDFTIEGYFLAWLIEGTDNRYIKKNSNEYYPKISSAIDHLIEIIDSFVKTRNSSIPIFVTKFLAKCKQKGTFPHIIHYFMNAVLPWSKVNNGRELLRLFLGLSHSLNWILADPDAFYDSLNELDEETKRITLFQFKMEIEEYYNNNYLIDGWEVGKINQEIMKKIVPEITSLDKINNNYSNVTIIPGKKWEIMRFNNISDYSKVTIPGYCAVCNSDQPFLLDTIEYLNDIVGAHRPYPSGVVLGDCSECGKQYGTGTRVMRFPWFIGAWIIHHT
jgi:hypothetical protein